MTTHIVRFSMDVSGSVISPLVMGQIAVAEFQTALAEVSNQFCFFVIIRQKRKDGDSKKRHNLIYFLVVQDSMFQLMNFYSELHRSNRKTPWTSRTSLNCKKYKSNFAMLYPKVSISGTSNMKYGSVVQEAVVVENVPYYSLEDLVSMPCQEFIQRGFTGDLNTALTTAVRSMTAFTQSM